MQNTEVTQEGRAGDYSKEEKREATKHSGQLNTALGNA